MNIIVCIKQVPDTNLALEIDLETGSLDPDDFSYTLNPYDCHAVEEAVRIKEKLGGKVTILCLGPSRVKKSLIICLAMGGDEAIHIRDPFFEDSDPFIISKALASAIRSLSYDLILCGIESMDGKNRCHGPFIAEILGIPHLSGIVKLDWIQEEKIALVHRRIEKGDRELIECLLPFLFTLEEEINEPRYPSFPDYLAAKEKEIIFLNARALGFRSTDFGPSSSRIRFLNLSPPRPRPKKIFTPPSTLPPAERMKLVLSGGLKNKSKRDLWEAPVHGLASKAIKFMKEQGISFITEVYVD